MTPPNSLRSILRMHDCLSRLGTAPCQVSKTIVYCLPRKSGVVALSF